MNLLSSVLAFVLLPLAASIFVWSGVAVSHLTRQRVSAGWASIGLLAASVFGLFLIFEFTGSVDSAVVIAKTDAIETEEYGLAPTVLHNFLTIVSPNPDGLSENAEYGRSYQLQLSAASFDRLHVGQEVALRRYSIGPLGMARLEGASFLEALPLEQLDRVFSAVAWPMTILACVLLLAIARFGRVGRLLILVIAIATTLFDLALTRYWWSFRDGQGPAKVVALERVASADIIDLLSVGRSTYSAYATHVTLPRPYDQVRLTFSPSAHDDAITVVDRVDSGTEGKLLPGDSVAVTFSTRNPRDASLATGSRSYVWRNLLVVYGAEAAVLIFLACAGAFLQKYWQRIQEFVRARRAGRR